MDNASLLTLNEQYAIPGHVSFETGPGGLAIARIENQYAAASVALLGGTVLSHQPQGQKDVLWLSPKSDLEVGKAIRGGIPVCWPWFGPHPTRDDLDKHGFVRTMLWSVSGTQALPDGATRVSLAVSDTPETRALWSYAFHMEISVVVGSALRVSWTVNNPGAEAFTYTGALHNYFYISDIRRIAVSGLEGTAYLDKTDDYARKILPGKLIFEKTTDSIFVDTTGDCLIEDPGFGRKIRVAKEGSHTTVVWNPAQRAALLPDLGEGAQAHFVCVETANAAPDVITVPAGGSAQIATVIRLE